MKKKKKRDNCRAGISSHLKNSVFPYVFDPWPLWLVTWVSLLPQLGYRACSPAFRLIGGLPQTSKVRLRFLCSQLSFCCYCQEEHLLDSKK